MGKNFQRPVLQKILSALTRRSGKQPSQHTSQLQRPATNDRNAWRAYWRSLNQPWRSEPKIDAQRQKILAQRRAINPYAGPGIYPFEGMKLERADIEWLLATHENELGPVWWNEESQRGRKGLNLRGANLEGENLQDLPLAQLRGGVSPDYAEETVEQLTRAGIHLERCLLASTHLEGAYLQLAHLEGATIGASYFQSADLSQAHLEGAVLVEVHLEGARLEGAHLESVKSRNLHLERASLKKAHLKGASLESVYLMEASLEDAYLEEAQLPEAHLEGANLSGAHLEGANLAGAHLEGANLSGAHLEGANLRGTFLDTATNLDHIILGDEKHGVTLLADIHWSEANLMVVDWSQLKIFGDEYEALKAKDRDTQLYEFLRAVRTYRQLSTVLQEQGLNEDAVRFAYRAQVLQKSVWWLRMLQHGAKLTQRLQALGAWLFSWFLFLLAGYGYKLWRSFLSYLFIIASFVGFYLLISTFTTPHLTWDEALVLSMSSFHGRGFFPSAISLGDPYARLSVIEGFFGLFVEVTLIATFTQRFFGK